MRSNRNLIPPSTAFVCTTYLSYLEDFCGFSRLSPALTALRGPEAMVGLQEGVRGIPGARCLVVCGVIGPGGEICPPQHPVRPKWAPWTQATRISSVGRPRLLGLPRPVSRIFSQPGLLWLPGSHAFIPALLPARLLWFLLLGRCPHLSSLFFLPVCILKSLSGPGAISAPPRCPSPPTLVRASCF